MTTADLLTRAQSALLTNQPNLAMLYMERATHYAMLDGFRDFIAAYRARQSMRPAL